MSENSRSLRIDTARVFIPALERSRYLAIWGGRGSGKSHFAADHLIRRALAAPGDYGGEGLRAVCIREVQRDLAQSSKALLELKIRSFGLSESDGFKVYRDELALPGDGIVIFRGMNDFSADSIKSLEAFRLAWWEEAHTASQRSINLLTPTIRTSGSSIWFTWNPNLKSDPVDVMFRGEEKPSDAIIIKADWRDNPWFTKELEQERLDCLRMQPALYDHIWEGGYATITEGAYYAQDIAKARQDGRIGFVSPDPLMTYRCFVDIGGTGAKADAFSMWVCQFVGTEIRVLDYYEAVGQPLATHLNWLRSQRYESAQIWLPHDGATNDRVHNVSFESAIRQAGWQVTVVPNQGRGAARQRIEATRRLFPSIRFNEATTEAGLQALGWYHEKRDEHRSVGLGPEHDWSSHAADAFGLMSVVYRPPETMRPLQYPELGLVA